MIWNKVNKDETQPKDEVLAINDCFDFLIGYLWYDEKGQEFVCEDGSQELRSVTHYVLNIELVKNFKNNK